MNGSLLLDAFDHHCWATIALLDACAALTDEQLATTVPGTYGSILDTLRHTVGADRSYLQVLGGEHLQDLDEDHASVADLRAVMVEDEAVWRVALTRDIAPAALIPRHRDDGSTSTAPLTIRLAQVVHHGTDHRSQVCTALTSLGIDPPLIDAWDYADQGGRLSETPPTPTTPTS
jgi:uncharacterized damage-inducible protein DinB